VTFLFFLLAACGLTCTHMACVDRLSIAIVDASGAEIDSFSGEAVLAEGTVAFTCTDGAGNGDGYTCDGNVVFFSTSEDSFALRVSGALGEGDFDDTVTPTYEEQFPNGDACPPACSTADIEITLDGCGDCG
jgi:hypothetical protein